MDLDGYYAHVREEGKLRTEHHAQNWSRGVLRTLGIVLDRGTKRKLAKALPAELADSLTGLFWLANFRDPNLSLDEFLQNAARRSGNSNGEFAFYPAGAVFSGVRAFIADELADEVADSLSPELGDFWTHAGAPQAVADSA